MSSVQDRIRSLQRERERAESSSAPVESVQSRARAVDHAEKHSSSSSAGAERSLSQLASRFDSADEADTARALSGRVAQFDAAAGAQSVQMRMKRLESDAQTGSIAGRAAAFETERGQIGDVAARFSRTPDEGDASAADALRNARARFEESASDGAAPRETPNVPKAPKAPKAPVPSADGASEKKNVSSRAAMFEKAGEGKRDGDAPIVGRPTPSLVSLGSDDSAAVTNDAVSRRAAVFENETGPGGKRCAVAKSAALFEKGRVVNAVEEDDQSAQKTETVTPKAPVEQKSVHDELREVKRANEQLLSTLLRLTASFRDLEKSRDHLQQKIAKLESK